MHNSRFLRLTKRLFWSLLLIVTSNGVSGQQVLQPADLVTEAEVEEIRRYSVELIIFQYNDPSVSGTEVFLADELPIEEETLLEFEQDDDGRYFGDLARQPEPVTVGVTDVDGNGVWPPFSADELILNEIPSFQQIGLRVMQPDEFVLNDVYDKLEELNAYTPLLRTAWVQETVAEEETRPINLRRLGDPPVKLDGHVALYLSRYLHLVLDLALEERQPQPQPNDFDRNERSSTERYGDSRVQFEDVNNPAGSYGLPGSGPVYFRIQEDRIVRNGELRYYDHPRFGAIAKITRIEETELQPGAPLPQDLGVPRDINQNTP